VSGKFRDECLNEHWFTELPDAKRMIEAWRIESTHSGRTVRWGVYRRRNFLLDTAKRKE